MNSKGLGNILDEIVKADKVPKRVYDREIDRLAKFPTTAFNRHKNQLGFLSEETYKESFSIMYRCTRSTKLRDFQFRFLHMRVVTNKDRMIYGQITSDLCTFCKTDREDIYHLMLHCSFSKKIWHYLQSFLYSKTKIYITFDAKDIILGNEFFPFFQLYNHLIILTKQYLYACKCQEILPEGNILKSKIEQEYEIEKLVGKFENKVDKFKGKWGPIFND